jgi:hypothetical protein
MLKQQIESAHFFNERILNTVYWTLSFVGAFTLLLVGFNWYMNFRFADRDKKLLAQELNSNVEMQVMALRTDMTTLIGTRTAEVVKSEVSKSLLDITDSLSLLKAKILELQFFKLEYEQTYWEQRNVPGNIITYAKERLSFASKYNNGLHIGAALNAITKTLKDNPNMALFHTNRSELISIIDDLPPRFEPDVEVIRALLRNVTVTS